MKQPTAQWLPCAHRCGGGCSLSASALVVDSPGVVVFVGLGLLDALAVLEDVALLAGLLFFFGGGGTDLERAGSGTGGTVALIGGFAGHRRVFVGKATGFAGVVDLHRGAVLVLGDEAVAGEEIGVLAVGAGTEQARIESGGAGGDQGEASAGGLGE